ncbi:PAP2 family protein [Lachnospiraceae bacterium KM106-2]|nr:PAP2 family protein [Lachnospiraceae bacterium KM106-2]
MELEILNFIQNQLKSPFMDSLMTFITTLGNGGIIWITIGVLCLGFKKTRPVGIQLLLAIALGFLIGNLGLKVLIGRQRPYTRNEDILLLIAEPKDYSFPSGHTLSSFAAAISIFFYNKKWGAAALVLASLIAFSRMYLYVHYPSDIAGGLLLAIVVAVLARYLIAKLREIRGRKKDGLHRM